MAMTKITNDEDRISYLPTFIIHQIMSHLSPKEVVQTSILSKRWNYLRTSFPILVFDDKFFFATEFEMFSASEERIHERIKDFMKYVYTFLTRFCELKVQMDKFSLSIGLPNIEGLPQFLDKWLELVAEHKVKELVVNIKTTRTKRYNLPQSLCSNKFVTSLVINGCNIAPSDNTSFCSLKKLELGNVYISDQIVQKLISESPLLEELIFARCCNLKCIHISKLHKLRTLHFHTSVPNEVQRLKIDAPTLEQLSLTFDRQQVPCVIDVDGCPNVKDFQLSGSIFRDEEFHYFVSKFPLLENLSVGTCHWLQRIVLSSNKLKKFTAGNCGSLNTLEIDTPNLLSFSYSTSEVPISSINAPCPWSVSFVNEYPVDNDWCLRMKKFLEVSNQIEDLDLYFNLSEVLFNLDEFQKASPSVPCEVGNLSILLCTKMSPSDAEAFLDGILCICYPKNFSIKWGDADLCKFVELLYEKLRSRDVNCCDSYHVKCWRHYLKAVKIESFQAFGDGQQIIVDNSMEMLPTLRPGIFQLQLEWCFPVLAEED